MLGDKCAYSKYAINFPFHSTIRTLAYYLLYLRYLKADPKYYYFYLMIILKHFYRNFVQRRIIFNNCQCMAFAWPLLLYLLGLRSKLLANEICVTSLDTLYFRLEHSRMPATTDSNTTNDPANKHSIGSNEIDKSFFKSFNGFNGPWAWLFLKLISMWMTLENPADPLACIWIHNDSVFSKWVTLNMDSLKDRVILSPSELTMVTLK